MRKNKLIKIFICLVTVIVVLVASITTFYADVYFVVDGYTFEPVDNNYVSLVSSDLETNGTDLVIPNAAYNRFVGSIKEFAFQDSEITSVNFNMANGLKEIGRYAFYNCNNITSLSLPYRVKQIGTAAFRGCSQLQTVNFGSGSNTIPAECFAECSSLQSFTFSDEVNTIEKFAFYDCKALTYIEIPVTVTSIDPTSFYGDENLILGVYFGSYAHQFAKDKGVRYTLLDSVILGDANGDGSVNINDVTAIQRHAAELEPLEGICFHAADVDGDGDVSVDDATELQRFLAEYAVDYPVGEKLLQ